MNNENSDAEFQIYSIQASDFMVSFKKDFYHEEYLQDLGLNIRRIKARILPKKNEKSRIQFMRSQIKFQNKQLQMS